MTKRKRSKKRRMIPKMLGLEMQERLIKQYDFDEVEYPDSFNWFETEKKKDKKRHKKSTKINVPVDVYHRFLKDSWISRVGTTNVSYFTEREVDKVDMHLVEWLNEVMIAYFERDIE